MCKSYAPYQTYNSVGNVTSFYACLYSVSIGIGYVSKSQKLWVVAQQECIIKTAVNRLCTTDGSCAAESHAISQCIDQHIAVAHCSYLGSKSFIQKTFVAVQQSMKLCFKYIHDLP